MADFSEFRKRYAACRKNKALGSIAGARILWEGKRRTKWSKIFITEELHPIIMEAVEGYNDFLNLEDEQWRSPCHMETWLFQERWEEFEALPKGPEVDVDAEIKRMEAASAERLARRYEKVIHAEGRFGTGDR